MTFLRGGNFFLFFFLEVFITVVLEVKINNSLIQLLGNHNIQKCTLQAIATTFKWQVKIKYEFRLGTD